VSISAGCSVTFASFLQEVIVLAEGELDGAPLMKAAAELRRVERDLHDGAQARLVALGISLRATVSRR
jgi:hypothetical protein